MIHAFILIILVNGEIVSDREPMLFFDINRCNVFASAIVSGKREARGINHDAVKLANRRRTGTQVKIRSIFHDQDFQVIFEFIISDGLHQ